MTDKHSIPKHLIEQFLLGNLSSIEEKKLLDWIDQNPESILRLKEEQERLRPVISAQKVETTDKQWSRLLSFIEPRQPNTSTKNRIRRSVIGITTIAASLVVGLILYSIFNFGPHKTKDVIVTYRSVTTTLGEKTSVTLPDGTKVNLNSGSKLRYPSSFSGTERKVELSGEAFFDVVKNETLPFIVQTHDLNVRVLGTKFNVEAFPNASAVNTTLISGKVILEKELNKKMVSLTEMKPNERAVYLINDQKLSLSTEKNLNQYIAWKDGKLVFLNDPVEEVVKKLGLWYNVSVVIKSEELKNSHFTGTFTNETIEKVLTLLSVSSPIDYKINDNYEIQDGDSLLKRQIILTIRH